MNEQVSANIAYLKAQKDTVSIATPANALDSIYQNTSGKIRVVTVSVTFYCDGTNTAICYVYVDSFTPPTTQRAYFGLASAGARNSYKTVSFIVPVNYYYKVAKTIAGSSLATVGPWTEWDLH